MTASFSGAHQSDLQTFVYGLWGKASGVVGGKGEVTQVSSITADNH